MHRLFIILGVVWLAACQSIPGSSPPEERMSDTMNEQLIGYAEIGDTPKVLKLLRDGADVNATDSRGRTAVMAAAYGNQADTVKALIEQGADLNARDDSLNNVLLYAGAEGYLDIVKLAITAGADPKLTNRFGGTALIPASERGHVEVVRELLEHSGIDVNHVNRLGWTALLEAIILGDGGAKHQQIVQMLVDHGADVRLPDGDGVTPLEHARNRGYGEIEKILKRSGV